MAQEIPVNGRETLGNLCWGNSLTRALDVCYRFCNIKKQSFLSTKHTELPTVPKKTSGRRDALGKALQILWWIVDTSGGSTDKEWGVRELAQGLHLPPATVHRGLTALMKHGVVQRNPDSGQYQIGMEFYRLAFKAQSHFGIRNASLPVMRDLVTQCNETALLGLYDSFRMEMMFIASVNSNHALRYVVPMNEWLPVYAGAAGLAIMAFLTKAERQAIIERTGLAPLTERTITNPIVLEEEFARIRARGYAFSRGERNIGAVGIAAPIWGSDGRVMGDLVVSMPEPRFNDAMVPTLASLVIQHAKRIIEKLGAQAPIERESG
jgi:IclR family transcriptional regulator, acetate operon repressor